MKFTQASLVAALVPAISARFVEPLEANNVVLNPHEKSFLVETAPGKTTWVTEDEKWELRRVSVHLARSSLTITYAVFTNKLTRAVL